MNTARGTNWQWVIPGFVAALVVYLVIAPLGILLYTSFRTVGLGEEGPFTLINYIDAYLNGETYKLLFNTTPKS